MITLLEYENAKEIISKYEKQQDLLKESIEKGKLYYFEYFIYKIYDKLLFEKSNFSVRLKIHYLLFLLVNANASPFGNNILLDIFDKFYAYPLGVRELDLYDIHDLKSFYISKSELTRKNDDFVYENDIVIEAINNAIDTLLKYNSEVFKLKSIELTNIIHKYSSWIYTFNQYDKIGGYKQIEKFYIQSDIKYFHDNREWF